MRCKFTVVASNCAVENRVLHNLASFSTSSLGRFGAAGLFRRRARRSVTYFTCFIIRFSKGRSLAAMVS